MQRKRNVEFAASLRHSNEMCASGELRSCQGVNVGSLESGDEEQKAMLGYPGVDLASFKGVELGDAEERESVAVNHGSPGSERAQFFKKNRTRLPPSRRYPRGLHSISTAIILPRIRIRPEAALAVPAWSLHEFYFAFPPLPSPIKCWTASKALGHPSLGIKSY
ncbi:hypothetical protein DFH09DRAFT_1105308 [Mycena vulgaris]|nr:hypothetical protein DFH09DRAFT_1105308 [Mycena vulgaris]